jgi:hypothetical protein
VRELLRRDVVTDRAGRDALGDQVAEEAVQPPVGRGDPVPAVQQLPEVGDPVLGAVVADAGVGLEHRLEALHRISDSGPECVEMVQVGVDVLLVPGQEDRLDVGEVLVERRPPIPAPRRPGTSAPTGARGAGRLVRHRPAGCGTLLTGLVMALGTRWGLFRFYWVVVTLTLTTFAVVVLLLHLPAISAGATAARIADAAGLDALGGDLFHASLGLAVLLANLVLNIYKPPGLTRYGWRRLNPARRPAPRAG